MQIQEIGQVYISLASMYGIFCFLSCKFDLYECFVMSLAWPIFALRDAYRLLRRNDEDG